MCVSIVLVMACVSAVSRAVTVDVTLIKWQK
jgi:hypothetical protein